MRRITFVLKLAGDRAAGVEAVRAMRRRFEAACAQDQIGNFSIWHMEEYLFGYGESEGGFDAMRALLGELPAGVELTCAPGSMRQMYHDIGVVRADKSLIRHRVFATRLKPGCEEEYKRRHDALIEARHGVPSPGPDSNFTIWNANGYIFGYDETDTAYRPDPSLPQKTPEEEKADTVAWETRQLEIMDWLTDDVDWLTGQKHAPSRCIFRQNA